MSFAPPVNVDPPADVDNQADTCWIRSASKLRRLQTAEENLGAVGEFRLTRNKNNTASDWTFPYRTEQRDRGAKPLKKQEAARGNLHPSRQRFFTAYCGIGISRIARGERQT